MDRNIYLIHVFLIAKQNSKRKVRTSGKKSYICKHIGKKNSQFRRAPRFQGKNSVSIYPTRKEFLHIFFNLTLLPYNARGNYTRINFRRKRDCS